MKKTQIGITDITYCLEPVIKSALCQKCRRSQPPKEKIDSLWWGDFKLNSDGTCNKYQDTREKRQR